MSITSKACRRRNPRPQNKDECGPISKYLVINISQYDEFNHVIVDIQICVMPSMLKPSTIWTKKVNRLNLTRV